MPRYPIYVTLLPEEAQAVIGVPYTSSAPAAKMLQREGFHHAGYVDVFDGGPTLEVERDRIVTVKTSKKATIGKVREVESAKRYMIGNTVLGDLRFVLEELEENEDGTVSLSPQAAEKLQLGEGDEVRYAL